MEPRAGLIHVSVSAVLGWLGTVCSLIMTHANTIAGLIAAAFAIGCSWYGIQVARATLRLRSVEERRATIELEKASEGVCRECRDGYPPPVCPIQPEHRPTNCPKKPK